MEYVVRINLWGAALALALGIGASIVTSTVVAARAIETRTKQQARQQQDVSVRGAARQRVRADLATWSITLRGGGKTLPEAFAQLTKAEDRTRAFLRENGFTGADLATSAIGTSTFFGRDTYGNETREVNGYSLTKSLTVRSAEVAKVGTVAAKVTSLIGEGLEVASSPPAYTISTLADLRVSLTGKAAADARARAEEIVKNAGGTLGAVRDVQVGVFQVTQPDSTEVSNYGQYDTGTIEKDVSVTVNAKFGVE